ncbi:MAG: MFS transporter [Nitrospirae bacterium]|nr:MAG: MFS transporter [Nitrospirota bacterium]
MKNPRQILAWCLYDFANSSYSAVVAAVVFPVYFSREIAHSPSEADLWWGMAISVSMALLALTSPFMGGISDLGGRRRFLFVLYTLLAVLSTSVIFMPHRGQILTAFFLIVIANFSTEGAVVFYNAYLKDMVPEDMRGRVSAWGFGLGYIGSVVSLLVALYLVGRGEYRLIGVFVSLFFLIFSLPAFFLLPRKDALSGLAVAGRKGIEIIMKTLRDALEEKKIRRFLISYFLYRDALNTVIVFASLYASTTLAFSQKELIWLFLLLQITASAGTFIFALPTDRWGAWEVVFLSITVWVVLSIGAYFVNTRTTFWIIALIGGVFLGIIQSASRALFCRFIPEGKEGEYFGIYALAGKSSSVIGPALFGAISSYTGDQRNGILMILAMFILGGVFLLGVKRHGI